MYGSSKLDEKIVIESQEYWPIVMKAVIKKCNENFRLYLNYLSGTYTKWTRLLGKNKEEDEEKINGKPEIKKEDRCFTTFGHDCHEKWEEDTNLAEELLKQIFIDEYLIESWISSSACCLIVKNLNELTLIEVGRDGKGLLGALFQKLFGDYYHYIIIN